MEFVLRRFSYYDIEIAYSVAPELPSFFLVHLKTVKISAKRAHSRGGVLSLRSNALFTHANFAEKLETFKILV